MRAFAKLLVQKIWGHVKARNYDVNLVVMLGCDLCVSCPLCHVFTANHANHVRIFQGRSQDFSVGGAYFQGAQGIPSKIGKFTEFGPLFFENGHFNKAKKNQKKYSLPPGGLTFRDPKVTSLSKTENVTDERTQFSRIKNKFEKNHLQMGPWPQKPPPPCYVSGIFICQTNGGDLIIFLFL